MIKKLHDNNILDQNTKRFLTTYNSVAPKIYGLPKTHKANVPLRPITSFVGSPTYKTSKYISQILRNIRNESYNIKNSYQFVDEIKEIKLQKNHMLISFDVVSLFTSIPVDLAMKCITDRWEDIAPHTLMNIEDFKQVLLFCLSSSYCEFKGKTYQQIEGLPMGRGGFSGGVQGVRHPPIIFGSRQNRQNQRQSAQFGKFGQS